MPEEIVLHRTLRSLGKKVPHYAVRGGTRFIPGVGWALNIMTVVGVAKVLTEKALAHRSKHPVVTPWMSDKINVGTYDQAPSSPPSMRYQHAASMMNTYNPYDDFIEGRN